MCVVSIFVSVSRIFNENDHAMPMSIELKTQFKAPLIFYNIKQHVTLVSHIRNGYKSGLNRHFLESQATII